jgi:hypothetical protein
MPASCPFCGATLNFGLKFCVVCGRHTSSNEMTKMGGGLKSGIKQQDATRRLDDNLSSSDFERTRKPTRLRKHVRSLGEHLFYLLVGATLFFCAIRFTLQTYFPGKVHRILAPILGKNSAVVEQTLTGTNTQSGNANKTENPEKKDKKAKSQPAATTDISQPTNPILKKIKHKLRRWHHKQHKPAQ